jgi:MerR family transcriptional regulator, heat shock protein HspR
MTSPSSADARAGGLPADRPVYVISVAAELAGMHPQTLRQYDRAGLVVPQRSSGRGRRYSARDIAALRLVQRLSKEGVGLPGIRRVLAMQAEIAGLRAQVMLLQHELQEHGLPAPDPAAARVFLAGSAGDVVDMRIRRRRPDPYPRPRQLEAGTDR